MFRPAHLPRRMALVVAAILIASCAARPAGWHGTPYDPPRPAPTFALDGTEGRQVKLADFAGKPLLLYFGYTSCPDFCPATMADLSWVFDQLGKTSANARVLFVTVDPVRDTDARLKSYLGQFNPTFLGARASDAVSLEAILADYGAYAAEDPPHTDNHEGQPAESVTFTHSARVFLIDADGSLITNYSFGTPREDLLADLQQLLRPG